MTVLRRTGTLRLVGETVLAAVRTAPRTTELREFPMPELPDDGALLKMEVAGICGTDVKMYSKPVINEPVIMGHENVGTIAKAGAKFVQFHGLGEGDRARLELAKTLGADFTIDVDAEDPLERVLEITAGKGVDVVLDCTAGAGTKPVLLGIDALKRRDGTLLVQGELAAFPDFPIKK